MPGERRGRLTDRVCYRARHYLLFLALRGFIRLDYAWLLGAGIEIKRRVKNPDIVGARIVIDDPQPCAGRNGSTTSSGAV